MPDVPGASRAARVLGSRWLSVGTGLLLAALWGVFARAHLGRFLLTHEPALPVFVAAEALAAALFVFRRSPVTVSTRPLDWLAGFVGTFLPLLLRPGAGGVWLGARHLLVVGGVLQVATLLALNRSFAVVAARRRVKTGGPYRVVRHPMYACYLVTCAAYAMAYTSPLNVGVGATVTVVNLLRLRREEAHLAQDADYRAYQSRVRWRLVPFVW